MFCTLIYKFFIYCLGQKQKERFCLAWWEQRTSPDEDSGHQVRPQLMCCMCNWVMCNNPSSRASRLHDRGCGAHIQIHAKCAQTSRSPYWNSIMVEWAAQRAVGRKIWWSYGCDFVTWWLSWCAFLLKAQCTLKHALLNTLLQKMLHN